MLKKLNAALLSLGFVLAFATVMPLPASAQQRDELCSGANLNITGSASDCSRGNPGRKVNSLIRTVINVFSVIVGITAVIMIIYGGFKYITSAGDTGSITTAKNIILYAIIGLIVVALAQTIVKFVLAKL